MSIISIPFLPLVDLAALISCILVLLDAISDIHRQHYHWKASMFVACHELSMFLPLTIVFPAYNRVQFGRQKGTKRPLGTSLLTFFSRTAQRNKFYVVFII